MLRRTFYRTGEGYTIDDEGEVVFGVPDTLARFPRLDGREYTNMKVTEGWDDPSKVCTTWQDRIALIALFAMAVSFAPIAILVGWWWLVVSMPVSILAGIYCIQRWERLSGAYRVQHIKHRMGG